MPIDINVLKHFYRSNGTRSEFIKNYFIRLIRNKIIDPNTKAFLEKGFKFYSRTINKVLQVPSDDSNFNEFVTFDYAMKNELCEFPFTIKLYHDAFLSISSYNEFQNIFNKMIKYRIETIKKGWAIKYGVEYDGEEFPLLENLSEEELLEWKDPRQDASYNLNKLTEEDLKR